MLEFLAGYFAGDGTVNLNGRLSWTTASETLAQQLQIVLLNLGAVSRRMKQRSRSSANSEYRDYWNVTVSGTDADVLASQMRLLPQRKLLTYEQVVRGIERAGRADNIPNTMNYWVTISDELQQVAVARAMANADYRSEERRVGKECQLRRSLEA